MQKDQRIVLKALIAVGVLCVLGYWVANAISASNERAAAEAALAAQRQEEERAEAKAQTEVLERLADGDLGTVRTLVKDCIKNGRGETVFYMAPDMKDHVKVRRLLKGMDPYNTYSKLAYIELPVMDDTTFHSTIARQTVDRNAKTGEVSLEFALTYEMEGFAGMKKGWGIMTCPLRGGQPHDPDIEVLYME